MLSANINASIIESNQKYGEAERNLRSLAIRDGETIRGSRELQGQSPYLINTSIDYRNDNGTRAGLYFNMQGKTLEVVGNGINPDIYTQPFESLNFTFSKSFGINNKRSYGLPTSTTVSIVFELLGAAVVISIIKISSSSDALLDN